jgi:dUTP pyrophosphatase
MRGFNKLKDNAIIPSRKTECSAGYDIHVPTDKEIIIRPSETVMVASNIAVFMDENEYFTIHIRSSAGIKKKLQLANGVGIIDSDYYGNEDNGGNIILAIRNYGNETVILQPGERIAQGIFHRYLTASDEKKPNEKRNGGIGSTGT